MTVELGVVVRYHQITSLQEHLQTCTATTMYSYCSNFTVSYFSKLELTDMNKRHFAEFFYNLAHSVGGLRFPPEH